MKINDIRKIAKTYGINSFGKGKVDLVRAIQLREGNFDCYGKVSDYCDQRECAFRSSCFEVAAQQNASRRPPSNL